MTYTAISIGPIYKTLTMARKPLELWAASYLFSRLMDCIIQSISANVTIISPAKIKTKNYGLYPDRVYMSSEIDIDTETIFSAALSKLSTETGLPKDYFNLMSVCVENITDNKMVIKMLNAKLDALELYSNPVDSEANKSVLKFLKDEGKIFNISHDNYCDLETIAKAGREKDSPFSYNRYICIVQADGDGVGQVVSNISTTDLSETVSPALLKFGEDAVEVIKDFGGFPIYAGGDDLLFIAPVVGKNGTNIFDLLKLIDKQFEPVKEVANEFKYKTSMSYGVSITYNKFPLYEALKTADNLLFQTAKNIDGKDAVAWKLQKHSGLTHEGDFSKSDDKLYPLFEELIKKSRIEEGLLSAIAFKIRANTAVLDTFLSDKNLLSVRIDSFYKKFIDNTGNYADCTKQILKNLLEKEMNKTEKNATKTATPNDDLKDERVQKIVTELYGMMRTAKFINGEKIKEDEK
ncbi:hypothetical protein FACS189414_1080 [Bacteroidia bacterium]|nr:hypothetical protein FACS189414_1080 [Bacteroidia bacterium]